MKRSYFKFILYFPCLIIILSCCSWGFYVHETATQLAVYMLPKQLQRFFFANIDSVTANAIRPDKRRSVDENESPKHFIGIENYGNGAIITMPRNLDSAIAKYSWDTLKKYGYIPFQILIEDSLLVNSFKQTNADSILFYSEDLAHYIEDINVPLHTTNNYNGELTDQKGLHALWESTIPELEISHYNLYQKHKAIYVENKTEAVWMALKRSHALLPEIFMKEQEVSENFSGNSKYVKEVHNGKNGFVYSDEFAKQYAAALTTTINDQFNYSANMVSDFWYTAWVDAGKPDLKSLYQLHRKDRRQLSKELKAYKRNNLVQDSLLRANKE